MASTNHIATQSRSFAMCHCCSTCGTPVFSTITITSRVSHTETMFNNTPVNVYVEQEIEKATDKIRQCGKERSVLGWMTDMPEDNAWNGMEFRYSIDNYTRATTWLSGLRCICPVCGSEEPWMGKTRTADLKEKLTEENFPLLYTSRDRALLWAKLVLQKKTEEIEARRAMPGAIEEAKAALAGKNARLEEITEALEQREGNRLLQEYTETVKNLRAEQYACKAFELKRKKELTRQVEEAEKQKADLQSEMSREKKALCQEKAVLENEAESLRALIVWPNVSAQEIIGSNIEALCLLAD